MEAMVLQPATDHWFVRVNGLTKTIVILGLLFSVLVVSVKTTQTLVWLILMGVFWTGVALTLNDRFLKLLIRSGVMFLILVMALPFHAQNPQDVVWWQVGPLTVYREGFRLFYTTFLKAFTVLALTLVLLGSTSYTQLLTVLQKMRVPSWILTILLHMLRLFFLMEQELTRMRRAMQARTGKIGFKRKVRILSAFSGVYLARLTERSERTYWAMLSRGFNGKFPFDYPMTFSKHDALFVLLAFLFLGGVVL